MDNLSTSNALKLAHRQLLQRMGAGWAHELRQPIAVIRNCLSVLRLDMQTPGGADLEAIERWVEVVSESCNHFDEVIKVQMDLLGCDVDAVQAGVSLPYVVSEVQRILRLHLGEATLQIDLAGEGDLGAIEHPQSLLQLFCLLFLETLEAAGTAHVRIESENKPDTVVVQLKLEQPGEKWAISDTVRSAFSALNIQVEVVNAQWLKLRWWRPTVNEQDGRRVRLTNH